MRIYYDKAQICKNGHIINDSMEKYPQRNKDFCDICGEPTITVCPSCKIDIKGAQYHRQEFGSSKLGPHYVAPSFCYHCGKPFPWTEINIEVAKELANELENLSNDEKDMLNQSIDDLAKHSPRTELAATRIKKILGKAKGPSLAFFKEVLFKISSEMAAKFFMGS